MAVKVDPIQFRVGDIVEVQITLTEVPIKRGAYQYGYQFAIAGTIDWIVYRGRLDIH